MGTKNQDRLQPIVIAIIAYSIKQRHYQLRSIIQLIVINALSKQQDVII